MQDDYIAHYGIKRRSGRYPWGSGERPYQSDPQKARLQRKYEKTEHKARTKSEEMSKIGSSRKEISEHDWRESNKLDNIQRKINRLEFKEVAESLGIYDKQIQNAMADYEWANKTAAKYKESGRLVNKIDETKVSKDAILDNVVWRIPIFGPSISYAITSNRDYTLKGAEYYEQVSKNFEKILSEKVPDYKNKRG